MGVSLYRKYRPQSFSEIVGQDPIVTTLLHQSAKRQFAHSYLFTGPRGVGKTTTARLLAKAANCLKPKKNGEPDNSCAACMSISGNKAIDIIEIDAASHTGVDNVRTAIIDTTRVHPTQLTYKVFIIDEVHMLSTSAFNALLKTLEEPPAHALFILATTELHKVPDTILSRCQRFMFHRISHAILAERIHAIAKQEKVKIDESVIERIAIRAEGSSRDAESILGQLMSFEQSHIKDEHADLVLPRSTFDDVSRFIHFIVHNDREEALSFINDFVDAGGHPNQFLDDVIVYIRSLLLAKQSSKKLQAYLSQQFPEKVLTRITHDAANVSDDALAQMLEVFIKVKKMYQYPPLPQLPLEIAVYESTMSRSESTDNPPPPQKPAESTVEVKPKQAPKQVIAKPSRKQSDLSLSVMKARWQDVTNTVREINRGLSMSMQVARPVDIEGTTVTIAVPYAFHKERIEIVEHSMLIQKTISETFGKNITLRCVIKDVVDKQAEKQQNVERVPSESLWDQVVDAFGDQLA